MSTSKARAKPAYHHGDLARALVEAALAILEEGGDPRSLTLREAARRAGVSAMAPYRHFADKNALLAGVAAVGFERLAAALADADAQGQEKSGPAEAAHAQGVAYVRFACANPALFRLMFTTMPLPQEGPLGEAADRAFDVLARRVGTLTSEDKVGVLALRNWSTVHGLAALLVDGQIKMEGLDPAGIADRVLRHD